MQEFLHVTLLEYRAKMGITFHQSVFCMYINTNYCLYIYEYNNEMKNYFIIGEIGTFKVLSPTVHQNSVFSNDKI